MTSGSYNFERLDDASFQTTRLYQQSQALRGMEAGILRAAGLKPSHDVLEVGSGPGFVSDLLAAFGAHAFEPCSPMGNPSLRHHHHTTSTQADAPA